MKSIGSSEVNRHRVKKDANGFATHIEYDKNNMKGPFDKQDTGVDEVLDMAEQFSFGFLDGASFLGSPDCVAAMEGVVFYGFKVAEYREVYNPKNTMKAVIYGQKLSEQSSLFYT